MAAYIKTVPLKTLRWLCQVDSKLPALPASEIPESERITTEQMTAQAKHITDALALWPKNEREALQARMAFEDKNAALTQKVTDDQLGGYCFYFSVFASGRREKW